MTQDSIGRAWQSAVCARQIGVAYSRRLDLNQDLVGLYLVEVDLLELELAVGLGHDEGCGCAGHLSFFFSSLLDYTASSVDMGGGRER